jgi:hypothetical protein
MTGAVVADLLVVVALIVMAVLIYRTRPRPTRVTVMPAALTAAEEERFVDDLTAHLQAYGAAIADYYDTTPGDR